MRITKDRLLAVTLIALISLAGCDSKPKGTTAGPATDGTNTPAVAPRQVADAFLKDLGEGKVTPARLTDGFKKKLTPPKQEADAVAAEWLTLFKGATFLIGEESRIGEATVVRGLAKFPNQSMAFTLRLKQDANGYKVDWLHRSERQGSEIKSPSDPDLAAAQDTVRNFIDLLLGGDFLQIPPLMTAEWKKKISPSAPDDIREGYDYGPGFLRRQTVNWKGDFNGYTLSTGDLSPNKESATFVATMNSGSMKIPYIVKALKNSATGEWLVSDFEKQQ